MINLKCVIAATQFAPPPPFPLPTEQKMHLVNALQNEYDEFYWRTHAAPSSSKTEKLEGEECHDINHEEVGGIQLRVNEAWLEKLGPTVDRLLAKCNDNSKTRSKLGGKHRGNSKRSRRGKKC